MENVLKKLESVLCDPKGRCCIHGSEQDRAIVDEALTAIRAARAQKQAEQEPVAWIEVERGIPMFARFADKYKPTGDGFIPLYAAPFNCKGKCCE